MGGQGNIKHGAAVQRCYDLKINVTGCPVVENPPPNPRDMGSISGQETKIPRTSWPKNQNIK